MVKIFNRLGNLFKFSKSQKKNDDVEFKINATNSKPKLQETKTPNENLIKKTSTLIQPIKHAYSKSDPVIFSKASQTEIKKLKRSHAVCDILKNKGDSARYLLSLRKPDELEPFSPSTLHQLETIKDKSIQTIKQAKKSTHYKSRSPSKVNKNSATTGISINTETRYSKLNSESSEIQSCPSSDLLEFKTTLAKIRQILNTENYKERSFNLEKVAPNVLQIKDTVSTQTLIVNDLKLTQDSCCMTSCSLNVKTPTSADFDQNDEAGTNKILPPTSCKTIVRPRCLRSRAGCTRTSFAKRSHGRIKSAKYKIKVAHGIQKDNGAKNRNSKKVEIIRRNVSQINTLSYETKSSSLTFDNSISKEKLTTSERYMSSETSKSFVNILKKSVGTQATNKSKKLEIPLITQSTLNDIIKDELQVSGFKNISSNTMTKIQNQFIKKIKPNEFMLSLDIPPKSMQCESNMEEDSYVGNYTQPSVIINRASLKTTWPFRNVRSKFTSCTNVSLIKNHHLLSEHSSAPDFSRKQSQITGFFLIQSPQKKYRDKVSQISKLFSTTNTEKYFYENPKLLYHVRNSSFFTSSCKTEAARVENSRKKRYTTFLEFTGRNVKGRKSNHDDDLHIDDKNTEIQRSLTNRSTQCENTGEVHEMVYRVVNDIFENYGKVFMRETEEKIKEVVQKDKEAMIESQSSQMNSSSSKHRRRNRSDDAILRRGEYRKKYRHKKSHSLSEDSKMSDKKPDKDEKDQHVLDLVERIKKLCNSKKLNSADYLLESALTNIIKEIIVECTLENQKTKKDKTPETAKEKECVDKAVKNLVKEIRSNTSVSSKKDFDKKRPRDKNVHPEYTLLVKKLKELEKLTKELSSKKKRRNVKRRSRSKIYDKLPKNSSKIKDTKYKSKRIKANTSELSKNLPSTVRHNIENYINDCPLCKDFEEKNERFFRNEVTKKMDDKTFKDKQSYSITISPPKNNKNPSKNRHSNDYMRIKMVRKQTITSNEEYEEEKDKPEDLMGKIAKEYIKKEYKIYNDKVVTNIASDLIQNHMNLKNIMKYNSNLEMAYKRMVNFCMFKGVLSPKD